MRTVGDWRRATIQLSTEDGLPASGVPTLAVTRGDGTTASVTMNVGTPTATYTPWTSDLYELTVSGQWIEAFTVAGDGKGVEDQLFFVLPRAGTAPSGERVYATTEDYADIIREAPDDDVDLRRALAAATRAVEDMLTASVYAVDSVTSLPTDTAVSTAIGEAVCRQAKYMIDTGDPYGTAGADPGYQSVTAGGISLSRGSGAGGTMTTGRRSPEAMAVLRSAGLLGHAPQTDVLWWQI